MTDSIYVLITAARNEAFYIEATIKAVLAQTLLPEKWVIVSDDSEDGTDDIVKKYSTLHDFISFIPAKKKRAAANFASKVHALNMGIDVLGDIQYDFIGILDADITFDPNYYETIITNFHRDSEIGIAGGFVYEKQKEIFESRPFNTTRSVAGGIQLFRRACYDSIGGFVPLRFGGEDWYCEIMAQMKGWEVRAFDDIKVFHHKSGSLKRGKNKECFRQGNMDYDLAVHPVFEILKCVGRMRGRPFVLNGLIRLAGFFSAYLSNRKRLVSKEFIAYHQTQQAKRLLSVFSIKKHMTRPATK